MKRIIFLTLLFFATLSLTAQNEIIYIDYDPDLEITGDNASLYIDFDGDGNNDIRLYTENSSVGPWYYIAATNSDWSFVNLDEANVTNDTPLSDLADWTPYICWNVHEGERFGVRHDHNGVAYYGWFRAQWFFTYEPTVAHIALDKYAYCTIPNYPLRWGQTALNESVEENVYKPVTIYPNPAKNTVNITFSDDTDCQSVEIYTLDGRLVKQQHSDLGTIDVSGLSTGVYVMNVIMGDGKDFTERVVKK